MSGLGFQARMWFTVEMSCGVRECFFCGSKLRYDLLSTMNIMNMVSEVGLVVWVWKFEGFEICIFEVWVFDI